MTPAIEALASARLVPVLVVHDTGTAVALAEALLLGGLPVVEVTLRTAAAEEVLRVLAAGGDLVVGAGTVVTPEQVDRAVACGARFLVSPGLSAAVVERAVANGIPIVPGVATASEIMAALALGLEVVKLFPAAQLGGPDAVRALSAPFPSVRFVPTGGVSAANLADYLAVPSVLAVGGRWMVPADLLDRGDVAGIAHRCAEAVALARGMS